MRRGVRTDIPAGSNTLTSRRRFCPQRYELFGRRGMDTDSGIELGFGCAAVHGHRQALDNFAGIWSNHMTAQNFIGFDIDDEFHHRSVPSPG